MAKWIRTRHYRPDLPYCKACEMGPSRILTIFVHHSNAWSDVAQPSARSREEKTLLDKGQIEVEIAILCAAITGEGRACVTRVTNLSSVRIFSIE